MSRYFATSGFLQRGSALQVTFLPAIWNRAEADSGEWGRMVRTHSWLFSLEEVFHFYAGICRIIYKRELFYKHQLWQYSGTPSYWWRLSFPICNSHLWMRADVQSPQVCLLNSKLVLPELYIGVPTSASVTLFNQTLLPSHFSWMVCYTTFNHLFRARIKSSREGRSNLHACHL